MRPANTTSSRVTRPGREPASPLPLARGPERGRAGRRVRLLGDGRRRGGGAERDGRGMERFAPAPVEAGAGPGRAEPVQRRARQGDDAAAHRRLERLARRRRHRRAAGEDQLPAPGQDEPERHHHPGPAAVAPALHRAVEGAIGPQQLGQLERRAAGDAGRQLERRVGQHGAQLGHRERLRAGRVDARLQRAGGGAGGQRCVGSALDGGERQERMRASSAVLMRAGARRGAGRGAGTGAGGEQEEAGATMGVKRHIGRPSYPGARTEGSPAGSAPAPSSPSRCVRATGLSRWHVVIRP